MHSLWISVWKQEKLQPLTHVVERVQHGEQTFARAAERVGRPLREQIGDQDLAEGAGLPFTVLEPQALVDPLLGRQAFADGELAEEGSGRIVVRCPAICLAELPSAGAG